MKSIFNCICTRYVTLSTTKQILYFIYNYAYKRMRGNNKNNGYHAFGSYRAAQA